MNQPSQLDLCRALGELELENEANHCYANCAIETFMWGCLSRRNFSLQDWGRLSRELSTLLLHQDADPIYLAHCSWFQTLIADWPERMGQADSSEFTHRLLRHADMTCCSNYWERRVQTGENLTIHDHGHAHMPLTLQFPDFAIQSGHIHLQALLRHWSHDMGMRAALTTAPEMICLHVDRLAQQDTGQLRKLDTTIGYHWVIDVPVFTHGTDLRHEHYQTVAVYSHLGRHTGGHYQAMLRVEAQNLPGSPAVGWLSCDDGRPPVPLWAPTRQFEQGVTCLWLCRIDVMDLPNWDAMRAVTEAPLPYDDHVDLMQMLASLPTQ